MPNPKLLAQLAAVQAAAGAARKASTDQYAHGRAFALIATVFDLMGDSMSEILTPAPAPASDKPAQAEILPKDEPDASKAKESTSDSKAQAGEQSKGSPEPQKAGQEAKA